MTHKRAHPFYDTQAWKRARKAALIRDNYRCTVCGVPLTGTGQARVDHIKPMKTYPHLALSLVNLRSLCTVHDAQAHREKGRRHRAIGPRVEYFSGCDANGLPLDSKHHWHNYKAKR